MHANGESAVRCTAWVGEPDKSRAPDAESAGSGRSGRRHLDLFSGIGGFAIAAQACGFETIAFSEINPYASKVLKRHWPDVPNLGDIRTVRGVRADLVTGGFPCQPFSTTGKRRGAEDDRALWPEMLRVIEDARPAWVLGENVAGFIGMELDNSLADLESIGYRTRAFVIPACAVDARHRRDRCWIVGHSDSLDGIPAQAGLPVLRPETPNADDVWHRWPDESGLDRVADGIPRRVDRNKGLGNAIVPQVAMQILSGIAALSFGRRGCGAGDGNGESQSGACSPTAELRDRSGSDTPTQNQTT